MKNITHEIEGVEFYPAATLKAQIGGILSAWGMNDEHVEITSSVMVDADSIGIDTHGLSMLTTYDERRRKGIITIDAKVETVHQTPVSAMVDGGGGLGYVPGVTAMRLAIDKAQAIGLAGAAVRNSSHFGATGYYTRMAAAEGLAAIAVTNCSVPSMAPTGGKEPKLGTNPFAFAIPARKHPAFSLDMATTTVAAGKIRNRANEGIPLPLGWANDADGNPTTDSSLYYKGRDTFTQTPLGGTADGASYKGYGLGAMVELLSTALTGASIVCSPNHGYKTPGTMELGHFFLVIDPKAFRPEGGSEETVDEFIEYMHATTPTDPDEPVMVAGEPENIIRAEREKTGIPVPPGLRGRIKEIARASNAEYLLD